MKIIRNINRLRHRFKNPVVTIGVFDGVHLGHRKILERIVKRAGEIGGTSIVLTFYPHPARLLRPNEPVPLLISPEHRIRLIKELGVRVLILLRFTDPFSKLSAEEFVKKILVERINVKEILVGEDFAFGRQRSGGISLLRKLSKRHGFKVTGIPAVRRYGAPISSTRIRRLITKGRIDEASRLLARPVSVLGTVKRGEGRGRFLGYPTANIDPHHEAIPPSGVYAVSVRFKKRTYGGILNIGRRPTFYKYSEPTIEVHIFNFKTSIYNKDLEIEFVKKIRDEKRFQKRAALIDQIRLDEKIARRILLSLLFVIGVLK